MLQRAVGRAAVRAYRVRRPPGRRILTARPHGWHRTWAQARSETSAVAKESAAVLRSQGVDAVLAALAVTCVAGLVIVGTVYARPGPNPPIGYVTAVDQDPDVVTAHDDPPVEPWTSTKPGAGRVTVEGDVGPPWTVVMPKAEAEQCHGGQAWRLVTGCA